MMSPGNRRSLQVVTALTMAAGLALELACGNPSGEGNGCQGTGAAHVIDAQTNQTFSPTPLTITKGTSVCWENNGSIAHTVTATSASPFDSSWFSGTPDVQLNPGAIYTRTFGNAGNYFYHCSIHPNMTGEIDVR